MVKKIAGRCRVSTAAVSQWRRVPKRRVDEVSEVTGIACEVLRPDLYPTTTSKLETSSEEKAASNFCPLPGEVAQ
jgi:DNA-binding transcriptional regulator YdaS (Cro superfamily)